ncbi:hypothetical protein ACQUD9_10245 [Vagococcus fluvialis]|uniref:hypothetical protein n=1 Tax=Vagococcus fluvialis TaxID=2738 RepID=UPI003D0FF90F
MEKYINDFINLAIGSGGWMILDRIYLRNRLESLIGEWQKENEEVEMPESMSSQEIVDELLNVAIKNNKLDSQNKRDIEKLQSELMEFLTPPPSVVNALFSQHYDNLPHEATDYYHLLNINNGFIKSSFLRAEEIEIDNSNWVIQPNSWANIDENVCQQCFESEGFGVLKNRLKRIIRMNLKGESWGFSYEQTPLFHEHSQFFPEEHSQFEISRKLHETMLQLVEIYPHYFISFDPLKDKVKHHSSFFGGKKNLPLFKEEATHEFDIPGFVTVSAALVDWPLSVIRLKTTSKKNLLNSIEYLNLRWQQYSYPSLDILAKNESGEVTHSLIPIFRIEDNMYVADLILVDESVAFNRTVNYENLLADKFSIVDQLGVINIKEDLEINDRLKEIVAENMLKQSVFKNTPEGETAFIRFVDTL